MTSHGKTYTHSFPLNGLKRWKSVGKVLGTRWVPVESVGRSVGKAEKNF